MTREERKLIVKVDLLEGRLAVKDHEIKGLNRVLEDKIKDLIHIRRELFKLRKTQNDN
tara:strand:- start:772 stop:945 length:174 start_codon:yes stop_codon:yes gene_type:complete